MKMPSKKGCVSFTGSPQQHMSKLMTVEVGTYMHILKGSWSFEKSNNNVFSLLGSLICLRLLLSLFYKSFIESVLTLSVRDKKQSQSYCEGCWQVDWLSTVMRSRSFRRHHISFGLIPIGQTVQHNFTPLHNDSDDHLSELVHIVVCVVFCLFVCFV